LLSVNIEIVFWISGSYMVIYGGEAFPAVCFIIQYYFLYMPTSEAE